MLVVYLIECLLLVVLAVMIVSYYTHHLTPFYARVLTVVSFTASLLPLIVLPWDIYESDLEQSPYLNTLKTTWQVVYYINFFLCWLVLPFGQEYQDSGQFTPRRKVRQSFIMNGILIGVLCTGATAIVIYLLIFQSFSIGQLPGVFATLVNVFGLTLVSIMLGFGLISFPKEFFLRRDYRKHVNFCHRNAQALHAQQHNIKQQIYAIREALRQGLRQDSQVQTVRSLIDEHFDLKGVMDEGDHEGLESKSTADLQKIVKKRILEHNACEGQLDELVDQLSATTQSYHQNGYLYKKIVYSSLFVASATISILIFFAELATFATFLAPINPLGILGWGGTAPYIGNLILTAYIAYIVTHTIFRIKIYKIFALYKKNSSASSLLFTAINLSRVCYPLCYNYLQIIGLPASTFLPFFGDVTIRQDLTIIFPILMLVFALLNLLDCYQKALGYLGLSSYAFDEEEAEELREEGRSILVERFKERNLKGNQLEMIQLL